MTTRHLGGGDIARWPAAKFVALVAVYCLAGGLAAPASADDRKLASELIRSRGFDVDEFDILSQNYVLKIYRIINPLADRAKLHKTPVVCGHGVAFDAANMMSASKLSRPRKPVVDARVTLYAMENGTDDKGLHFYLANNNYDVWLIESRATNLPSRKRLSGHNEKAFWDFSLDEQALIDLPVQLEFVLQRTQSPKLAYVAYSQSTTMMFMLLSMKPEWADKLTTFVALAPVVFTSHLKGVMWPMSFTRSYAQTSAAMPVVPNIIRKMHNFVLTYLCSISYIKYTLCRFIWWQMAGEDHQAELDGGMTEDILKSTSYKSYEQYLQNSLNHDLRMYDYKDEQRNMEEYGQPVPPQYNITKIKLTTIALFRGTNDYLSDAQDQMILLSRLRVPLYEDHVLEDYAHLDFIASPTVVRDINEPILRILDKTTGRKVERAIHTLGQPNEQVKGTQLVVDLHGDNGKTPEDERGGRGKEQSKGTLAYNSVPKAEQPKDGVSNKINARTIKDELLGRAPTRPKSEQNIGGHSDSTNK